MYKLFLILLSLIVLSPVSALSYSPANDGPIVIKTRNGDIDDGGPRDSSVVPIRGLVMGTSIYLDFSTCLGDVDVTLEEYYDGLILHTVIDTSSPTAIINFSGDSGDYIITFTLASGVEYVGTFGIN